MSNDIYCDEVLNGRLPVKKIMETEIVLAFHIQDRLTKFTLW